MTPQDLVAVDEHQIRESIFLIPGGFRSRVIADNQVSLAAARTCGVMWLLSTSAAAQDVNPFLTHYPVKTAVIAYEANNGARKQMTYVKDDKIRTEDVIGFFATGTYSIITPDYQYNVIPEQKKAIKLRSESGQLNDVYDRLDEGQKAAVRQSIAKVGPDLPYYSEQDIAFLNVQTIQGLDATCYTFHSDMLEDTSTRCFWRRILVRHDGTNPISGESVNGHITSAALDKPLDDSIFTVPAGYEIEPATQMDDLTRALREQLIERMTRRGFTLNDLSRYRN
jgi:hypothetical protein